MRDFNSPYPPEIYLLRRMKVEPDPSLVRDGFITVYDFYIHIFYVSKRVTSSESFNKL